MGPFSTTQYPYNTVVYITDVIGGISYQGSGVLISPDEVLTATHVVYSSEYGTATNIVVSPGYNQGVTPYGSASGVYFHYLQIQDPNDIISNSDSQYDYAVIHLSKKFSVGWMGYESNYAGGLVDVTGYPASSYEQMVDSYQSASKDPTYSLLDGTSLGSGSSGGPVWITQNGGPYVVGTVSSGSLTGTGYFTQITSAEFNQLRAWVAADDARPILDPNNLAFSGNVTGPYDYIDTLNLVAGYADLIGTLGTDPSAEANWYNSQEAIEKRPDIFDGLDYIASYGDLINAFRGAGSERNVLDAGATHFITSGYNEGRNISFNALDYIASYSDLINAFGVNGERLSLHRARRR